MPAKRRKPPVRKTAARKPVARKTAARKPVARKAPARKTAARKTPARKTTKRASRDLVANPNRTKDNYGFTYYPGQSSDRDVPLRAYEFSDTRTYTPSILSPEPLKEPPTYPGPTPPGGTTTTTTTPKGREPWRHERIGRPTPPKIPLSPEIMRTPPPTTTIPAITPETTTEPPPPSTGAIPIPWDGWEGPTG